MLLKTHLLVGLFFALLLLPSENKLTFILIVLLASIIPDIDSRGSIIGKKKTFRILQFFVKHRGIIHSLTFLLIASLIFWFTFPWIVLPFVLGFGSHLLMDGLTKQGVKLFYPINIKMKGFVRVGGRLETAVFVLFLVVDLVLIFERVFGVFW